MKIKYSATLCARGPAPRKNLPLGGPGTNTENHAKKSRAIQALKYMYTDLALTREPGRHHGKKHRTTKFKKISALKIDGKTSEQQPKRTALLTKWGSVDRESKCSKNTGDAQSLREPRSDPAFRIEWSR